MEDWVNLSRKAIRRSKSENGCNAPSRISPWSSLAKYTWGLVSIHFTLSSGENLHDFVGPFLPYSLLDTVVWLAHVTSAGGMPMVLWTVRRSMFYLTLPSNSSMNYCPNNTLTHYTTKFSKITDLDGTWEIGLAEIQYPHSWYSVKNNEAWLKVHFYKESEPDTSNRDASLL
jgi:hypothetical protein